MTQENREARIGWQMSGRTAKIQAKCSFGDVKESREFLTPYSRVLSPVKRNDSAQCESTRDEYKYDSDRKSSLEINVRADKFMPLQINIFLCGRLNTIFEVDFYTLNSSIYNDIQFF